MRGTDRRGGNWGQLLRYMKLPLCAFAALAILAGGEIWTFRTTLLKNAYETGTALARSYAAEERGNLNVYETLLGFGTVAVESRLEQGESPEEVADFLAMYFQRLDAVLGNGVVDPYTLQLEIND